MKTMTDNDSCLKCVERDVSHCLFECLIAKDYDRLKAENAKLREVMGLAVEDLQLCDICDYCLNRNTNENCDCECEKCQDVCVCRDCTHGTSYQWQYIDKLKEIETLNTTKQL